MPKLLNQKGFAPIILIIILTVVIAGIAGSVYKSRKEIKVRSDKTTEVTELKGTSESASDKNAVSQDKTGGLSSQVFQSKNKPPDSKPGMPNFKFSPPAGWSESGSRNNIIADFTSPSDDKVSEGVAWITLTPDMAVFAKEKKEIGTLDQAFEYATSDLAKSGQELLSSEKVKVNGTEAYFVETRLDVGELSKDSFETQMRQALKESGEKISEPRPQRPPGILRRQKLRLLESLSKFQRLSLPRSYRTLG
ncbi:MAG: hypothetical protein UY10_C0031G0003 [Microgenomates group bacterium GW2011_GWA2_47_8]|nr:MAG: hypothetical protein UY10_C0031G0003 [Microgenomates group bacterium GW2011_GWA2_47_8]